MITSANASFIDVRMPFLIVDFFLIIFFLLMKLVFNNIRLNCMTYTILHNFTFFVNLVQDKF